MSKTSENRKNQNKNRDTHINKKIQMKERWKKISKKVVKITSLDWTNQYDNYASKMHWFGKKDNEYRWWWSLLYYSCHLYNRWDLIWLDKTKKNHTRKPLNLEKKVGFFGDFPKKIVIILLPVWCPLPIKN